MEMSQLMIFRKTNGEVPATQTELLWQLPTNSRVGYLSEMCSTPDKNICMGFQKELDKNKHIPVSVI